MRSYPSWIAGLEHEAPDGTNRRLYCTQLRVGEKLDLLPEPDNAFDPKAMALFHAGHHLGYLPKRHAWVWSSYHEGDTLACEIEDVALNADGLADRIRLKISVVADGDDESLDDEPPDDEDDNREGEDDVDSVEVVRRYKVVHVTVVPDEVALGPTPVADAIPDQRPPPPRRRHRGLVAPLIALVLIAGGVGAYGVNEWRQRGAARDVRIAYARTLNEFYSRSNKPAEVTSLGSEAETLSFKSSEMTRSAAATLSNEGRLGANANQIGFRTIVFSDGKSVWLYNVPAARFDQ